MGTYGILRAETDWAKVRMYGRLGASIQFEEGEYLELWTYRLHLRKYLYKRGKHFLPDPVKAGLRRSVHEARKEIQRIHLGF